MEVQKSDQSAQAKIWKFIYGFVDTLVLRSAIELGIADIINNHGEPITLSDLATQLPVQPTNTNNLFRIMRYLVHVKLFTKEVDDDGTVRYGLQPAAKFILKGWDRSMVPAIIAITDKDFMSPWHYLKDGLAGGRTTAFEKALGKGIWDYMAENPAQNQLFNEAMACDTRLLTSALIRDCKDMFNGMKSLIDIGGGTGTALRAIAKAFPHMKCTVFDLPHVIADSPNYPEVDRVEGDMFKSIPSADAILMKCILHDWADDECIKILKQCKEAVPRDGGKVIIVDIVLDMDPVHPYNNMRLCMDLDMMLNTGGKERTEEEWKKLILSAGFSGYKIKHISAVQSVIEAYPY
ncbi:(RS)-norcoclaurine 6-O-methyltransferase-like [Magnolia sinica]|uniref:(RS)-norcoclaurine 6-O-methyltransferase-like n=1 Tax=Magnolia sinica TaxID=86752 RepID=UPI002659DAEF|nr:(RS)-norcoclaurine 6-O-methyltransferase-like [Magnolia sinica]